MLYHLVRKEPLAGAGPEFFTRGGGGGPDPEAIHNLFHFKIIL
jgi:hypothetical protein